MVTFLKSCVFEADAATASIDPKQATFGQLTFQTDQKQLCVLMPRADLERLQHEIAAALKSAPLPARKRKVVSSSAKRPNR
jgi:hypothetical protein